MASTTRASTLYTSLHVNKYLADARDLHGRKTFIPFAHTTVTEQAAASALVRDFVQLCVIPANAEVRSIEIHFEAMSISAGVAVLADIGDADDDNRYMAALDVDVAGTSRALARAGWRYRPTADAIVLLKWTGPASGAPVVGRDLYGEIGVILAPGS